jgi:glycine/D-amino acid oxidase-like deaminating enzyme
MHDVAQPQPATRKDVIMPASGTTAALPARASVVIIGGGVIGASIAFHLAEAGVTDVVLLERDTPGSGSTCKAAGGVRAQFSDALNIELGARSLEAFTRFGQRPGQEIDLHQVGYLFLLSTPDDVAAFERDVKLQNELGVASRIYRERRGAGSRMLPDGRGRMAAYETLPQHELVISGDNLARYAELIGFADTEKFARLHAALAQYRRKLNRERFVARLPCWEA